MPSSAVLPAGVSSLPPVSLFWLTFFNKKSKIAGVGHFCFPITSPLSNPSPPTSLLFPLHSSPSQSLLLPHLCPRVFLLAVCSSLLHPCSPCQAFWITNYSSISSRALAKVTGWGKKDALILCEDLAFVSVRSKWI